jgi:hypothetical protein
LWLLQEQYIKSFPEKRESTELDKECVALEERASELSNEVAQKQRERITGTHMNWKKFVAFCVGIAKTRHEITMLEKAEYSPCAKMRRMNNENEGCSKLNGTALNNGALQMKSQTSRSALMQLFPKPKYEPSKIGRSARITQGSGSCNFRLTFAEQLKEIERSSAVSSPRALPTRSGVQHSQTISKLISDLELAKGSSQVDQLPNPDSSMQKREPVAHTPAREPAASVKPTFTVPNAPPNFQRPWMIQEIQAVVPESTVSSETLTAPPQSSAANAPAPSAALNGNTARMGSSALSTQTQFAVPAPPKRRSTKLAPPPAASAPSATNVPTPQRQ